MGVVLSPKKFTSDTCWYGFRMVMQHSRAIILLPLISRTLGQDALGIFIQIQGTVTLLTPLIMIGLDQACIRFLTRDKNQQEVASLFLSMLFVLVSIYILFSVIILGFREEIALLIFAEESKRSVVYVFFLVLILAFRVPFEFIGRFHTGMLNIKFSSKIGTCSIVVLAIC